MTKIDENVERPSLVVDSIAGIIIIEPRDMTKLRSAWASAQSDQSLRCPHEESLGP